jgi:hypothetical protein
MKKDRIIYRTGEYNSLENKLNESISQVNSSINSLTSTVDTKVPSDSEIKVKMLPDTAEPTVGDGCMAFWSDTSGSLPYDVWLLFKPVGASQVKVKLV